MNLLLITQDYPPRPGGMSRYYADLARGLGEDCVVAMSGWKGQPPEPQGEERILTLPFATRESHRPWNKLQTRRRLSAAVAEHGTDALLIANVRPYALPGIRLGRKHDLPTVLFVHGTDILQTSRRWNSKPVKRGRWRKVTSQVDLCVTNSAFTAECARDLGFPADRIEIVHPEVDNVLFRPAVDEAEKKEIRERLGIPSDELVTLFAGRLQDCKGVPELLQAFARLETPSRLVLCSVVDPAPWKQRAHDLGIADRTHFTTGTRDETALLFRSADLFVHPSRHHGPLNEAEGFGIVFIEAAASGVPSIGTRTGGIPDSVDDGVSGVLVPPQNVDELAAAWDRLLDDDDERRRLAKGALESQSKRHGRGTSAARLREILRERFG